MQPKPRTHSSTVRSFEHACHTQENPICLCMRAASPTEVACIPRTDVTNHRARGSAGTEKREEREKSFARSPGLFPPLSLGAPVSIFVTHTRSVGFPQRETPTTERKKGSRSETGGFLKGEEKATNEGGFRAFPSSLCPLSLSLFESLSLSSF